MKKMILTNIKNRKIIIRKRILIGSCLLLYIIIMLFFELTNGFSENISYGIKLFFNQNKIIQESKRVADDFLILVKAQDFLKASNYLTYNYNLEKEFTGEAAISSFKYSGQRVYALDEIELYYFAEGVPTENRNIWLTLKKISNSWIIESIKITYHIPREAKEKILLYLEHLTANKFNEADLLCKNLTNKQYVETFFTANPNIQWHPIQADSFHYKHFPTEYNIEFLSEDEKYSIKIECTYIKLDYNYFYIKRVLIENLKKFSIN